MPLSHSVFGMYSPSSLARRVRLNLLERRLTHRGLSDTKIQPSHHPQNLGLSEPERRRNYVDHLGGR
jgi:hypothetical protein